MSYKLEFESRVKKDFANIGRENSVIIMKVLSEFAANFSHEYEQELLKTTKIKALKGGYEGLYRLKIRSFRAIYKKKDNELIILVLRAAAKKEAYRE
ncbi:MAG: type II toxin-antitoxin system mRNA interferase toxin, RelE/StbE family [Campylobacter sp.]|uniref:type II toxin-antitoxin system RelE family toxin n=1 Tax=Campylobacter sp. TaxID=205 RepID=UPI002AA62227|nr:type II toxin-antitoxin system mRNA interferase toxin, RelE/StbE family [Campylobacter sp.]MCI7247471.1 type II toxin-antitoxin system mRNA interferase toxin, RelE/StbE family [Campylobacter sp.]